MSTQNGNTNEFAQAAADLINDPAEILKYWESIVSQLDSLKSLELELRNRLITHYFPHSEHDLPEGTQWYQLTPTTRLKCVFKVNHNLTKNDVELLVATMAMSKLGYDWEKLIKFKPQLSATEYNKLPHQIKTIADTIITSTPSQPSISIVEDE